MKIVNILLFYFLISFNSIYSMEITSKIIENDIQQRCLEDLPDELILLILNFLDPKDEVLNKNQFIKNLINFSMVNKKFNTIAHDIKFIISIIEKHLGKKISLQQDLNNEFLASAENGDIFIIFLMLCIGVNPNISKNFWEATALHIASRKGHTKIVKMLLNKGANPNIKDKSHASALFGPAINGNIAILKALVNKGADINTKGLRGNTPLINAASTGNLEVIKFLLFKGADVNAQNKDGFTALMAGAQRNHIDIVRVLLNKGANFNIEGEYDLNALMHAAFFGNFEIVKLLLQVGTNINLHTLNKIKNIKREYKIILDLVNSYHNLFNRAKNSDNISELKKILAEVIEKGYSAILKLLLKKQMFVNFEDLKLAKDHNNKAVGKILINHLGLSSYISIISKQGLGLPIEISSHIASFMHD